MWEGVDGRDVGIGPSPILQVQYSSTSSQWYWTIECFLLLEGKDWTNVWVNVPPADSISTEDSVARLFVHMIWVVLQKSMVISGQVMGYCPPAVGCL